MNIAAVRQGLANAVKAAVPELNCTPHVPAIPETPAFYVLGPDITYDVTFGGHDDIDEWVCRILVNPADDLDAQAALDEYLSRGAKSVKLAIEGTPGVAQTLGGACSDVHVRRAQNYGEVNHGGTPYYGAELVVHIVGDPE